MAALLGVLATITVISAIHYATHGSHANSFIIITTSYEYREKTKEYAEKYPDIQFCQATGSNVNEDPRLSNYHTFMGSIYQGKYICGVVAGSFGGERY